MKSELELLSKALKRRGFVVQICETGDDAIEHVDKIVKMPNSIGIGNSITLKDIGLYELVTKYTDNILSHEPVGTEDLDRQALTSDLYFTSANAISIDGQIVNIDGTGNRTAATCFGPKHVIFMIGKNKIANNLEGAIARAKEVAVKIARKYNRKTPCVKSGKCEDCNSPESVCAVTAIHRKKPYGVDITVILINEELGL